MSLRKDGQLKSVSVHVLRETLVPIGRFIRDSALIVAPPT